jgi:DNA-binding NtrC family response regulator
VVDPDHLPAAVVRPEASSARGALKFAASPQSGGLKLVDVERDLVEKALDQAKGNKSRAARLLGLLRAQLYSRIEKYGVQ